MEPCVKLKYHRRAGGYGIVRRYIAVYGNLVSHRAVVRRRTAVCRDLLIPSRVVGKYPEATDIIIARAR